MITYGKQSIDQSDVDAVIQVLKGDLLTQGPAVEKFENDLKFYFGAKHCCAVANGTASLHLTGLALGWKPGDIVITSPMTFLASANCIIYAGATPDFVDIDAVSYTIDADRLEERIKDYIKKGKQVKAVVAIDFSGHPCDWEALRTIAKQYELKLVNDNSHALGATYFGDKQYASKYADVVTQSYHPVKHITTGEGGAVFTNDPAIGEKVKCLRTHGMIKNTDLLGNNDATWYYEIGEVGYNYRITDFQCALGSSQLKKLDKFLHKRRGIAKKYDELFSNIDTLKIPKVTDSIGHAYHLYPLQIDFDKLTITKEEIFNKMKASGINLQVHYIPVHLQPFYQQKFGFKTGDFPISESFYRNEVSLPIYPELSTEDVSFVVNNIMEIISA
tara:strand:+ start:356 stop:1519 length:1164 start_codon:yes stop_codon:yes gene_type:complete